MRVRGSRLCRPTKSADAHLVEIFQTGVSPAEAEGVLRAEHGWVPEEGGQVGACKSWRQYGASGPTGACRPTGGTLRGLGPAPRLAELGTTVPEGGGAGVLCRTTALQ